MLSPQAEAALETLTAAASERPEHLDAVRAHWRSGQRPKASDHEAARFTRWKISQHGISLPWIGDEP